MATPGSDGKPCVRVGVKKAGGAAHALAQLSTAIDEVRAGETCAVRAQGREAVLKDTGAPANPDEGTGTSSRENGTVTVAQGSLRRELSQ